MRNEEAKHERKKKIFMSVFIVAIMTLSVLGYMFGENSSEKIKYNGFNFFVENNKLATKINDKTFYFEYSPEKITSINISPEIISKLKNNFEIDMTSDPDSYSKEAIALVEFELSEALFNNNQFTRLGFLKTNSFNISIINCSSAKENMPVIVFEDYNETFASINENCIFLKAKSEQDFTLMKDRLLYGILGIVK